MSSSDLTQGSHQIAVIAEIPSLRESKATEAISRNSRFYLKFPTMSSPDLIGGSHQTTVIAEIPSLRAKRSDRSNLAQSLTRSLNKKA